MSKRFLPTIVVVVAGLALVLAPVPSAAQPIEQGAGHDSTGVASGESPGVGAQAAWNVELVGQIGGATYAVAVEGNYAYIGVGPRLVILDVSTPSHPVVVGQTGVLPGVVEGVAVAGGCAYVADGSGGLRVVNVANPGAPVEVGHYDTPGRAEGVAVAGG